MKNLMLLVILFITSVTVQGQDLAPKVIYIDHKSDTDHLAYYLNGELSHKSLLHTIDPSQIADISINKESFTIDQVKYEGAMHIKLKENYLPQYTSLHDLKVKYTNLKEGATIFFLDNNLIDENDKQYMVDEHYILKMVVSKTTHSMGDSGVNIVQLFTRSKANMERNQIIIKGQGKL